MLVSSASRNIIPSYRAALLKAALQQQSHFASSSNRSSRSSRPRPQQQHLLLQSDHHLATRARGGVALGMSTASASSAAASSMEGAAMRFDQMQLAECNACILCSYKKGANEERDCRVTYLVRHWSSSYVTIAAIALRCRWRFLYCRVLVPSLIHTARYVVTKGLLARVSSLSTLVAFPESRLFLKARRIRLCTE